MVAPSSGQAVCGHGAAGTRRQPPGSAPSSRAARPRAPPPSWPHQPVTSFKSPGAAEPRREPNSPEIVATWRPKAASQGLSRKGNQLRRAVSTQPLFMMDGAQMRTLPWLRSPSTPSFCCSHLPPTRLSSPLRTPLLGRALPAAAVWIQSEPTAPHRKAVQRRGRGLRSPSKAHRSVSHAICLSASY